ncbi:hypothetical protein [Aquimarina sp. 2201CG5-10]|uniref:hypothetical protein n=1 Tax=Aquimarina callyspongiae TaxID=3098150 RepID=UPI002AB56FA3|nr:hypothetical protein [Aquimarina sp. 2201CG5-10]MDY8138070.1 hypothetical protein [Aquimarina sp. 2201CG5-10]
MAKKIQKPKKCISVEEARELQESWCNRKGGHLKKKLGFEDAREFHWSVAELEEYLAYVKQESAEQGIKNPGIRMYYGAYPEKKCKMGRGYSTLFLTPTGAPARSGGKDGGDEPNNYNIDSFNSGSSGIPPKNF